MAWPDRTLARRRPGARWLLAVGICLALDAPAQTGAADPPAVLPAVPATPGLAGDTLTVTRFEFEGSSALSAEELDALAAPFLNRPLRFVELEELRQRIGRALVARGRVGSGALIPEQALRDGVVRLRLIEGSVARLSVGGLQGLSRRYLAARLVQPGDPLDVERLQERFRLLLADPLFERINVRVLPGEELGRSVVDVDLARARPWQLTLFAHNHQAPAVGSAVLGVDALVRNLSGWGDTLAGTLSRSRGGTGYDLGWTLPLAARATTLGARVARAHSSVVEEPLAALDIDSVVTTREATLAHPLIDRARVRLSVGLTRAERRNRTRLDGEPFSFVAGEPTGSTEVRSWRLAQELVLRSERHALALRSTFVSGHSNLPDAPALDAQPQRRYRLWIGQAQASLAAGDAGAQWLLRGQVQRAGDRLVPLEQFSVGGRHTVRGYRENQLVRDGGYAVSVEYHQPLAWGDAPGQRLTLIPFVDAGSARDRGAASTRLASAGLGLQWRHAGLDAELFYARRIERRPADTHGDLQDHGIHVSLRWRPF